METRRDDFYSLPSVFMPQECIELSSSSDEISGNREPLEDDEDLVITGYIPPINPIPSSPLTTNTRYNLRRRREPNTAAISDDMEVNIGAVFPSPTSRLDRHLMILSTSSTTQRRSNRRTSNRRAVRVTQRRRGRRRAQRTILDNILTSFFNNGGGDEEGEIDYNQALEIASRLGNVKKTGLTNIELANLPKRPHVGIEADCTICLESIRKDNPTIVLDNCGHLFHEGCAMEWLKIKAECPTCRGKVIPPKMIFL